MKKYAIGQGELFSNGVVSELEISAFAGSDIRVRASGSGSCKVVGKLGVEGDYVTLALVRLSDFSVVDTIEDNEIYAADISGVHRISLADASGFTSVYAMILA